MRRTNRPASFPARANLVWAEALEPRALLAAQPDELALRAEADAHVRNGSFADTNFGSAAQLEVNPSGAAGARRDSYLRFGIADAAEVGSATLRLFGRLDGAALSDTPFLVLPSNDVTWGEQTVTWNNPVVSESGDRTLTVSGAEARWYEFDVSGVVQQAADLGRTAVTFVIRGASLSESTFKVDSDEGANPPQLVVRRDPPAVPPEIVVRTPFVDVTEGMTSPFTVHLATKPAADVVLTMTKDPGGDPSLTASQSSVTITPDNWYQDHSLHVAAANDADASNGWASFTLSVPGGQPKTVTAGVVDNDAPVLPTVGLRASADAHVRDGTYSGTNFGSAAALEVRNSGTGASNRLTYVKFDLTGTKAFQNAKLRVFGDMDAAAPDPFIQVSVGTTLGSWTESGITWNNKPEMLPQRFGDLRMERQFPAQWYELDVTRWVLEQKASGATSVTFVLAIGLRTSLTRFNSDEAASNRPELSLTNYEAAGSTDPSPPSPGPAPDTLHSTGDAYVRDGSYAGTNYGNAAQLQVKRGAAGYTRESYLNFSLGAPSQGEITSAKLRLFGKLDNTNAPSVAFGAFPLAPVKVWSESSITWNNRPPSSATAVGSGTVVGTAGKWYELDLTDYAKQLVAQGDSELTVVLKALASSSSTIVFESDEPRGNRPELVVTRANTGSPAPQALVLSSPSLSVPEGGSASFTVRLAAKPDADVAVTVTRDPAGDGDITPADAALLFTPDNWDVPQSVHLSAAQDADSANGSNVYTVAAAGLTSRTLTATEADDDAPPAAPVVLRAAADAYVRDGSTYSGTNFGAAPQLQVKKGAVGWNRDSYLRFDLSEVSSSVSSAKLRLFGALDNTQNVSVAFAVHTAPDTTWGESAVTWDTRPPSDTTVHGTGTVSGITGKWYEVDLTSLIATLKAGGATAVTLVIKSTATSSSTVLFNSDEGANRPELSITP